MDPHSSGTDPLARTPVENGPARTCARTGTDRHGREQTACTSWHRVVTRARVCYISLHPSTIPLDMY